MNHQELIAEMRINETSNPRLFSQIMIACRFIFFVYAAVVYAVFVISNSDQEFNFVEYSNRTILCIAGLGFVFLFQVIILICLLNKLMSCEIYKESCLATLLYWLSNCLFVIFGKF